MLYVLIDAGGYSHSATYPRLSEDLGGVNCCRTEKEFLLVLANVHKVTFDVVFPIAAVFVVVVEGRIRGATKRDEFSNRTS